MAADAGLFIGWNRSYPDHMQAAIGLFGETAEFLAGQQAAGQIESFEPVVLSPHGGDLNGFILVRGDPEKLIALRMSEDFRNLVARAQVHLDGVGILAAFIGDGARGEMERLMQAASG